MWRKENETDKTENVRCQLFHKREPLTFHWTDTIVKKQFFQTDFLDAKNQYNLYIYFFFMVYFEVKNQKVRTSFRFKKKGKLHQ